MVKFKIIQVYRSNQFDYYDDDNVYPHSVMLSGHAEWEECDENTFDQIVAGMALLNSKAKNKEFQYMAIRIPEPQSELADLSQKEFLKHVESVKKRERAAETARQAKLEAERKKKEDRERKKYLKLKSMFEPGLVAEQKNS
jgi:hypothetical protein